MAMTSSDCKGCKERAINCHATCACYLEYVKVHEKEKKEYREFMGINFEQPEKLRRFLRKLRHFYCTHSKMYRR